jgi:pyrimidine operon attenuation protein/uracil phosphoribosyltransferase
MAHSQTVASGSIHTAIAQMASAIAERHSAPGPLLLLGIANGGIVLARRLAAAMRPRAVKVGTLDISFHRDDIGRHPIPKEFTPTLLPVDITGAALVLVDDVLFTGRTIKAALDELFDHGRPARVELAVLVDRGDRRLPIAADYAGLRLVADARKKVMVLLDPADPDRDLIKVTPL